MRVIFENVINDNRRVLKMQDGMFCLADCNKRISCFFDFIDDFKYNEDLDNYVAMVKINIGKFLRKKDTLIGFIDIDGNFVSNFYSVYFDKFFNVTDMNILINNIYDRLFYESNIEENKENSAIKKMKLLFKKDNL